MRIPRPPLASTLALALFFAALFAPTAQAPEARAQVIQLAALPAESAAIARIVRVAPGNTLKGILTNAGVAAGGAQEAIDALRPIWNPRELKAGQEIALRFRSARLAELHFATAIDRDVIVARTDDGHFTSRARQRPLTRVPELAAGVIRSSLSEAASDSGVPMSVLTQMIRIFSYDVDFQRDVQPDNSFEVLYERLHDESGKAVGTGEITYASMTLSGKTLRLYRYAPAGAPSAGFFNERGESVRKALLKTPVDGARLSSGFGIRHHPILGYTKMHRGVDFAAPQGTPIIAAGDGVVDSASRSGAYGNLVVLHHSGGLDTAYAHMSRIAAGVKPGVRLHQGEVIGYIGATGRATGPHLHYEVRIKGEPTNPLAIKMQPGIPLAGADLAAFAGIARAIDRAVLAMREATIVAALPIGRWPE